MDTLSDLWANNDDARQVVLGVVGALVSGLLMMLLGSLAARRNARRERRRASLFGGRGADQNTNRGPLRRTAPGTNQLVAVPPPRRAIEVVNEAGEVIAAKLKRERFAQNRFVVPAADHDLAEALAKAEPGDILRLPSGSEARDVHTLQALNARARAMAQTSGLADAQRGMAAQQQSALGGLSGLGGSLLGGLL